MGVWVGTGVDSGEEVLVGAGVAVDVGSAATAVPGAVLSDGVETGASEHPVNAMAMSIAPSTTIAISLDNSVSLITSSSRG